MLSSAREALLRPPFATGMAPAAVGVATSSWAAGAERGMAEGKTQRSNPDDLKRSAWMAAAQAGDRLAYEALLRDCVPIIQSVARRVRVPPDQIDDVVQDVLLSIHRARATYDPARSFTAWLRVIAERRAIDAIRRSSRRRLREVHNPIEYDSHADPGADPSRGVHHADGASRVERALAELPERQREAVRQLVLEERSLAEASAATQRSEGALKVNLHRALKALRATFGQGD
jgi:RNA polymerase sigma factor (sigma-70 family)